MTAHYVSVSKQRQTAAFFLSSNRIVFQCNIAACYYTYTSIILQESFIRSRWVCVCVCTSELSLAMCARTFVLLNVSQWVVFPSMWNGTIFVDKISHPFFFSSLSWRFSYNLFLLHCIVQRLALLRSAVIQTIKCECTNFYIDPLNFPPAFDCGVLDAVYNDDDGGDDDTKKRNSSLAMIQDSFSFFSSDY